MLKVAHNIRTPFVDCFLTTFLVKFLILPLFVNLYGYKLLTLSKQSLAILFTLLNCLYLDNLTKLSSYLPLLGIDNPLRVLWTLAPVS